MRKVLGILILISVMAYGEELPQLKATVSEKNDRIEIRINKLEKQETKKQDKKISKINSRVIRHKVKKGEILSEIVKKYKVSMSQILEQNKQIKNRNLIYVGDTLKIKK